MRKKTKNKQSTGFTLLEVLISIGVFAAISSIIVTVLFISFRASKKSEVVVSLKQNGDSVLSQIVKSIRYAQSLDNPVSCTTPVTRSSITITSILDNAQTTFSCPVGAATSISSNSAALLDSSIVAVSACSFTCSQPTINDPPTITVEFTLSARNTTNFVETTGAIPFQTAVTLRNFSR
jgi:prepilin-type N-terminal cleavage/methylation domain-containing protein